MDFKSLNTLPKDVDSLESIDQDYVLVPGPPTDLSSSAHASIQSHLPFKSGSPPLNSVNMTSTPSAPVPIIGAATGRVGYARSLESRSSAPGTSQGSMEIGDTFEKPSTDFMTRIKSLQHCASAITELVKERIEAGKQLEAFSIQLLILAIWKQALYICHTHAASATEGSPIQETTKLREISKVRHSHDVLDCSDDIKTRGPMEIYSQIERAFVHEVGYAEELAKVIEPGNTDMPDAMELIYQSALGLGRHGAVDEYMGDAENAVVFYSKAVCLLVFILVEAPCLILNPPFSLTNTERCRIQNYIDALNNRQNISRSQRMALFKSENQP
ncbi:Protein kinase superfamily protein [Forsythia ovata]|uniref:Protein kinase superfamily protein n=1 Tax=Forsythia ovata TaxID=205694 RepID=A0ABD1SQI7_9LAMI